MSREEGALGMAEWVLQSMRITTNKRGIITVVIEQITVHTADHYWIVSNCS